MRLVARRLGFLSSALALLDLGGVDDDTDVGGEGVRAPASGRLAVLDLGDGKGRHVGHELVGKGDEVLVGLGVHERHQLLEVRVGRLPRLEKGALVDHLGGLGGRRPVEERRDGHAEEVDHLPAQLVAEDDGVLGLAEHGTHRLALRHDEALLAEDDVVRENARHLVGVLGHDGGHLEDLDGGVLLDADGPDGGRLVADQQAPGADEVLVHGQHDDKKGKRGRFTQSDAHLS